MDKAKAKKRAATLAIAIIVVLWVVIYIAYVHLSRPLGEELAGWISLVLGLFIGGTLFPVQNAYVNWEAKRYCAKNGHVLKHDVASDGKPFVYCTTCFAVVGGRAGGNARPNP